MSEFSKNNIDELSVFKFLVPDDNDMLSKMSGLDLQDLIIFIEDCYIELRDRLGLAPQVTFGLELELEHTKKDEIYKQLHKVFPNGEWIVKPDSSLNNGIEINSPVLTDKTATWTSLDQVCSIVEPLGFIAANSGGHIHIGTQVLGDKKEAWLNFIKLWSVYENIIFRFGYGIYLTARESLLEYAGPIAKDLWKEYEYFNANQSSLWEIIMRLTFRRRQAVNFKNVSIEECDKLKLRNTIEFRCPNGSLDAAIWQNNVNFFVHMLLYSRSAAFDDDLVEKRHLVNLDRFAELKWYDEIYLDQALELGDMLFTNNFDKVYFLKQYLKSLEVWKDRIDYSRSCTLTKKKN